MSGAMLANDQKIKNTAMVGLIKEGVKWEFRTKFIDLLYERDKEIPKPISLLKKEIHENVLLTAITGLIIHFTGVFNVIRNMSPMQIAAIANYLLLQDDMSFEDYTTMFHRATKGELVKIMDRIDYGVIATLLNDYRTNINRKKPLAWYHANKRDEVRDLLVRENRYIFKVDSSNKPEESNYSAKETFEKYLNQWEMRQMIGLEPDYDDVRNPVTVKGEVYRVPFEFAKGEYSEARRQYLAKYQDVDAEIKTIMHYDASGVSRQHIRLP